MINQKFLLFLIFLANVLCLHAQDYSGSWYPRDPNDECVLEVDQWIVLKKQSDGSYVGELIYNGKSYTILGQIPYPVYNNSFFKMPVSIYKNGNKVEEAVILLYKIDRNRIDFICTSRNRIFSSIEDMYCQETVDKESAAALDRLYREQLAAQNKQQKQYNDQYAYNNYIQNQVYRERMPMLSAAYGKKAHKDWIYKFEFSGRVIEHNWKARDRSGQYKIAGSDTYRYGSYYVEKEKSSTGYTTQYIYVRWDNGLEEKMELRTRGREIILKVKDRYIYYEKPIHY